ncbi:uncharacterized protein LOC107042042 [Diachasma alloeum]|uniref:uncharacterized protein LOC107042042 n=1 Tax=Diachasma alloeum TaxID=454923 RepID=UPI00073813F4|nr:uncharacterized protein LOC107042042 [Diachasma alloeum]
MARPRQQSHQHLSTPVVVRTSATPSHTRTLSETTAKETEVEECETLIPNFRDTVTSPEMDAKSSKKRKEQVATSPPEWRTHLPKTSEWQEAKGKKDKRKKQPTEQLPQQRKHAARPDALIIRPKVKGSYSDILKRMKQDATARESHHCVDKIRKAATGDMLIILSKEHSDKAPGLQNAITELFGDDAEVLSKTPEEDVEIKDLEETATKEEILEALQKAGESCGISLNAIKSLRKAYGGTQTAWVRLPVATTKKIVGEYGKIKIGWVNCRIRRVERPLKCFKCWDFGHLANKCKNLVDRSKNCIKCGEGGHLVAKCEKHAKCVLCVAKDRMHNSAHIAGSGKCPAYKEALQALTKNRR